MSDILKHGAFSWNELTTTDTGAALDFYTKLFGWKLEVKHMETMDYIIAKVGDEMVAGVMAAPPDAPVAWTSYVTVDDIDETARLAESLGGVICVPPTDIPRIGRFAIMRDPQGAIFAAITYLKAPSLLGQ